MAYLATSGARLWYEESGAGPAIIFLHPFSGSSAIWIKQINDFVAAGYRCVCYDRRHRGRSETLPDAQDVFVSEDLERLLDHLAIESCHLVAAAGGGAVAIDSALSCPGRISSLVLSATHCGLRDDDYLEMQQRIFPQELHGLPWSLLELSSGYRAFDAPGTQAWMEASASALLHDATQRSQRPRATATSDALRTIAAPVLLVAGGADWLTPPVLMRKLLECFPHGQMKVLAETGHAPHWERPEAWNRTVLDFLGHVDP